ncbi:MAG: minor capsid protein [Clostridiaceae bacterium]|nr:minor capsid protein [Clostridiaceae bacterium]
MADLNKEIIGIAEDSRKQAAKASNDILKIYKRNLDDVRQQVANLYMQYTVDGELKISKAQRLKELSALEKQLSEQIKVLRTKEGEAVTNAIGKAAEDSYYSTLYMLDKGIKSGVKTAPLKSEFVEQIAKSKIEGKTFSDRIWNNTGKLADRVKKDVEKALIQGTSPEKLARQIKSDLGSTAYQAQRVMNTEIARAVSAAQDECYQNSGVVQYVMWDATLDAATSEECAANDGKIFSLDDHPDLPAHPNCRCSLVPVVDGWSPTSKRENVKDPETGQKSVVDYTTIQSWRESRGL